MIIIIINITIIFIIIIIVIIVIIDMAKRCQLIIQRNGSEPLNPHYQ